MSYCWRTSFSTTKPSFLQRLLQSLGAFKEVIGAGKSQRFRVRQQYRVVFGMGGECQKRMLVARMGLTIALRH
jgi:hypothetical protein